MEEWVKYKAAVYSYSGITLPEEQQKQLRMAFFGGATAAGHVMMRDLSPGDQSTEADLDILRDMHKELEKFAIDVKEGRA